MRKIAIITGASSGNGGATAVALAERGVDSIVTFNSHADRVRDVAWFSRVSRDDPGLSGTKSGSPRKTMESSLYYGLQAIAPV